MSSYSSGSRWLFARIARRGLAVVALVFMATTLPAQPAAIATELAAIKERIAAKVADGKRTEADFAAELAAFDALIAKHAENTENATWAAFAKGQFIAQTIRRTPWMARPQLAFSTAPLAIEFAAIEKRIGLKLMDGKRTEADFAPELADIDALLVKYPEKTEEAAMVLHSKADLYAQVMKSSAKARAALVQMEKDYPNTDSAKRQATMRTEREQRLVQSESQQKSLIGKSAPEIHFEWVSRPGMQKLSDLRGQVVVLDFWATWCAPCIKSFPQVRAKVEHFRGSPVVILGVTSLQGKVHGLQAKPIDVKDDAAREYALTAEFKAKHEMTWDIAFSVQKVFNPDYVVTGIPAVVIIDPAGKVRHLGLNPLLPESAIAEKVTALLQEFNLPLPATRH